MQAVKGRDEHNRLSVNGGMSCLYSVVLIESYTACVRINAHSKERPNILVKEGIPEQVKSVMVP